MYNSSREQYFTEKLYFSMRELAREVYKYKNTDQDPTKCSTDLDTNLAGDLGLQSTVDLAITSPYLNIATKLSGTDGAFGGYVNFVVTKNLNMVGPTWVLKHFKGPGSLGSLSEVNNDKLIFAFARGDNAGKPFDVRGTEPIRPSAKAKSLLNTIILNEISTQLSGIRVNTQ